MSQTQNFLLEESREIIDKINSGLLSYTPDEPQELKDACTKAITGGKRVRCTK